MEEAVELVRAQAEAGERLALAELAGLLARHGRVGEAIDVLRPHLADWFLLEALAEATEGHGRDAEVADLVRTLVESETGTGKPGNAVIVLSRTLERQGRADEAVEVLSAHIDSGHHRNVNTLEEFAGLLARQDRLGLLRAFVAGPHGLYGVSPLAERLAELGRLDEAVEALRPFADASANAASSLVDLLGRHGRVDEAIEVARPHLAESDCTCMLAVVLELMTDHGRAAEALGLLAEVVEHTRAEERDSLAHYRIWLLGEAGRTEEALAEAQGLGQDAYPSRAVSVARLLADRGRREEAIAALQGTTEDSDRRELAHLLIEQGRPNEAVDLLRLSAIHRMS
ncbi:hypothetical protein ACFY1J_26190 [Streptomyces sp. NPDC001406]|uniref:hypothetical protein n=1 Tax=Streptomyces sp. NPDC001406 TaxID=3364572 RepID=UPI0036C7ACD2